MPGDGIVWVPEEGEVCTVGELQHFLDNMPDAHIVHLYHGPKERGIYVSVTAP